MSVHTTPARENQQVEYREARGFPGYRVGSDGTAWSCRRLGGRDPSAERVTGRWRLLKLTPQSPGRDLHVTLMRDGVPHLRIIHRLVLEAFVGPCPPGKQARHLDGNPANNRLDNLCWGTPKENQADRIRHGTHNRGEQNLNARLTSARVLSIRSEYAAGTGTLESLATEHGVSTDAIRSVVNRKNWKHVSAEPTKAPECSRGRRVIVRHLRPEGTP